MAFQAIADCFVTSREQGLVTTAEAVLPLFVSGFTQDDADTIAARLWQQKAEAYAEEAAKDGKTVWDVFHADMFGNIEHALRFTPVGPFVDELYWFESVRQYGWNLAAIAVTKYTAPPPGQKVGA
jgi:hypothetical protein